MEYVLEESEIDAKCLVVFHFVSMDTILMEEESVPMFSSEK